MNNKLPSKAGFSLKRFKTESFFSKFYGQAIKRTAAAVMTFALLFALALPIPFIGDSNLLSDNVSIVPTVSANGTYYDFLSGNLTLALTGPDNRITSNDNWSGVASVEGYFGRNLVGTHGIDPQTVLNTEFVGDVLPSAGNTQVNANKGNPSAYNAGGVTEFDRDTPYAFGIQGNVQATPYMVFYLNTTGRSNVTVAYDVIDIDAGSNNSVSQVALQYRIGSTGNFTNLPAGFVADATQGPTIAGLVSARSVVLPADANNQSQVQVRLLTTNAAGIDGNSTPDEWIGINNVVISAFFPTAATANVGGQVFSSLNRPLANAVITMIDPMGDIRTARTNTFGYYNFPEVIVGETYVLEIRSKRYIFPNPTQIVTVNEDLDSINFYAEPYYQITYDYPMRY